MIEALQSAGNGAYFDVLPVRKAAAGLPLLLLVVAPTLALVYYTISQMTER